MDQNPLRIIEDDLLVDGGGCDNVDNIESREQFESEKRNSLLIVEDKDLMMDDNNNIHRLSLQIESGDSDSLVMTNEAINRTIIRIGSNGGVDFGELNNSETGSCDTPPEAINHEIQPFSNAEVEDNDNEDDGNEAIVNILGQIDEIVGFIFCMCKMKFWGIFRYVVSVINNFRVCTLSHVSLLITFVSCYQKVVKCRHSRCTNILKCPYLLSHIMTHRILFLYFLG